MHIAEQLQSITYQQNHCMSKKSSKSHQNNAKRSKGTQNVAPNHSASHSPHHKYHQIQRYAPSASSQLYMHLHTLQKTNQCHPCFQKAAYKLASPLNQHSKPGKPCLKDPIKQQLHQNSAIKESSNPKAAVFSRKCQRKLMPPLGCHHLLCPPERRGSSQQSIKSKKEKKPSQECFGRNGRRRGEGKAGGHMATEQDISAKKQLNFLQFCCKGDQRVKTQQKQSEQGRFELFHQKHQARRSVELPQSLDFGQDKTKTEHNNLNTNYNTNQSKNSSVHPRAQNRARGKARDQEKLNLARITALIKQQQLIAQQQHSHLANNSVAAKQKANQNGEFSLQKLCQVSPEKKVFWRSEKIDRFALNRVEDVELEQQVYLKPIQVAKGQEGHQFIQGEIYASGLKEKKTLSQEKEKALSQAKQKAISQAKQKAISQEKEKSHAQEKTKGRGNFKNYAYHVEPVSEWMTKERQQWGEGCGRLGSAAANAKAQKWAKHC